MLQTKPWRLVFNMAVAIMLSLMINLCTNVVTQEDIEIDDITEAPNETFISNGCPGREIRIPALNSSVTLTCIAKEDEDDIQVALSWNADTGPPRLVNQCLFSNPNSCNELSFLRPSFTFDWFTGPIVNGVTFTYWGLFPNLADNVTLACDDDDCLIFIGPEPTSATTGENGNSTIATTTENGNTTRDCRGVCDVGVIVGPVVAVVVVGGAVAIIVYVWYKKKHKAHRDQSNDLGNDALANENVDAPSNNGTHKEKIDETTAISMQEAPQQTKDHTPSAEGKGKTKRSPASATEDCGNVLDKENAEPGNDAAQKQTAAHKSVIHVRTPDSRPLPEPNTKHTATTPSSGRLSPLKNHLTSVERNSYTEPNAKQPLPDISPRQ